MKNVKLISISVEGFRSFTDDQTLKLPHRHGFYFLTGENKVDPEMGANATGKSSTWDSMIWCLYGKTARGLRGKHVVNWSEETRFTSVSIELDIDGILYDITRTRNPNRLLLRTQNDKSKVIEQDELNALVGIDLVGFCYASFYGQFNKFFVDLNSTEKMAIFSQALDLNCWLGMADVAATGRKKYEFLINDIKQEVEGVRGRIKQIDQDIESNRKLAAEYDANKLTVKLFTMQKSETLQHEINTHNETIAKLETAKAAQSTVLSKSRAKSDAVEKQLEKLISEDRQLQSEVGHWASSTSAARKSLDRLKNLKAKCPRCSSIVSERQKTKLIVAATKRLADYERDKKLVERESLSLSESIGAVRNKFDNVRALVAQQSSDIAVCVDKLSAAALENQSNIERLTQAQAKLKEIKADINPYTVLTVKQLRDRNRVEVDLEEVQAKLEKHERLEKSHEFWAKEFKRVRLWLIKEALLQLEIETNNTLEVLGLKNWRVSYDIERENSIGSVSKGFTMLVKSPNNEAAVPWETWSGGETQRIRIASSMAMAQLIQNRLGVTFGFEIWDEPTTHLSEEGVYDMLSFLKARSRQLRRQVWLVDHRSLSLSSFDGHVTVVKTKHGSRFRQR